MKEQHLSAENYRLLGNAREMIREADTYYDQHLKEKYDERDRYVEGDHWHGIPRKHWQSDIVVNLPRWAIDWYASLLTDSPARLAVQGRDPADYQQGQQGEPSRIETCNKVMRYIWTALDMDNRDAVAWQYALKHGIAWYKVFINPDKKWVVPGGNPQNPDDWITGDLDVSVLSARHLRVDPRAAWSANVVEATDRAEYMVQKEVVPIRRLVRRYPHLESQIENAMASAQDLEPWAYQESTPGSFGRGMQHSEFIPQGNMPGGSSYTGGQELYTSGRPQDHYKGRVAVCNEIWMRDDDYPGGMVVLDTVNDLLLQKRPDPENNIEAPFDHGNFPFIPKVANPIPGRIEGYGVVDIVIPIINALNKRHGQIEDILNFVKNLPMLYEEDSIDLEKFSMEPGARIPYKRGSDKPTFMQAPNLPPGLFESVDMYMGLCYRLLGLEDAIRGPEVKAGAANVALETAIEQAMQPIRNMIRWNTAGDKRLGQQILSVAQQLYGQSGFIARVTGAQGSVLLQPDDITAMRDLEITRGITIKIKEAEQFKKMMDMASAQPLENRGIAIPDDEIIDVSGAANPEALKEKVRQARDIQQEIMQLRQENEMLQSQMPPPQPGGGAPMPGGM